MTLLGSCTSLGDEDSLDLIVRSVRHALLGREPSDVTSSRGRWPRIASIVYHSRMYRILYLLAGWMAVTLLPAFEPPVVYSNDAPLTTRRAAWLRAFDAGWLILCGVDLVLQTILVGRERAAKRGWMWVKGVSLIGLAANGLAAAFGAPYVLRVLRPLLLIERMRNVRKLMASIASTAPRVLSVGLLMIINLLLHATLGFVLFAGIDGVQCKPFRATDTPICSTMLNFPQSCQNFFATLGETTLHLFELTTAVNFPAIAVPVVRCNEWNMLFFISYIITGSYLLFNLALVVAYSEFYTGLRGEALTRTSRICGGCDLALTRLLPGGGGVRAASAFAAAAAADRSTQKCHRVG